MPSTSSLPFGNASSMSTTAPVTDIGDAPQDLRNKPALCLYRVGRITKPGSLAKISLAEAVAASSAFQPFLSPMVLDVVPSDFEVQAGADLQELPYTTEMVLTDGGVYDNLGLETVWKKAAAARGGLLPFFRAYGRCDFIRIS